MEVVVNRLIELSSGKDDELRDISTLGIAHTPLCVRFAHVNDSTEKYLCRNTERCQHRLVCMLSIGPATSRAVTECTHLKYPAVHVSYLPQDHYSSRDPGRDPFRIDNPYNSVP